MSGGTALKGFADWLSRTAPSVFIQQHEAWMIPTIQSAHIVGIGVVLASVLMMTLRIYGLVGVDRTLQQTRRRFGPWLTGALLLLLATGLLMVVGEPERELVTFSFWLKMALVAVGASVAFWFQGSLRRHEDDWEVRLARRGSVRLLAAMTFLIWLAVIFLGRLIAYDHVWGPLSPATKA